jgi:putative methionine-R-sulfoxide reductase with GAF domain
MLTNQNEAGSVAPPGPVLLPDAVKVMLEGEQDLIADLANVSALVKFYLSEVNWAGVLPAQGKGPGTGAFSGPPGLHPDRLG